MHTRSALSIFLFVNFIGGVGLFCRKTPEPSPSEEVVPTAPPAAIEMAYPLDGTVFPPELPPPTFRWKMGSSGADTFRVSVTLEGAHPVVENTRMHEWTPDSALWRSIKSGSVSAPATVTIEGLITRDAIRVVSKGQTAFSTSRDPVGAPLFYREVPLPFIDAVKDPSRIRWRFGAIDGPEAPPVVLEKLPVCGNCHSFSADGKTLGMDVDYANDKGSYVVTDTQKQIALEKRDIITWSDFDRDDKQPTFGLLSQVSPDGRYVVSTVKDRSVFVPRADKAFSQLFFPLKGILAVYDRETGEIRALPGADDPTFVHSNPAWSPDGKEIVFARARAYDLKYLKDETTALLSAEECAEFLEGGKTFTFDLYRIPFNRGKGGEARPVEGASKNGRSNFFAKFSPDGRWIVYCQANSFMLLQPDAEMFIIPSAGGAPRRLRANVAPMSSWHSFSPNGKWLVFASKAATPYTELFLTHIGPDGDSAPAVRLDYMTASDRAANIPEFVNLPPNAIEAIHEAFINDISFVRTAMENVRAGDLQAAEAFLEKALAENPENTEALAVLGGILSDSGRSEAAIEVLKRAVAAAPSDGVAHYNLGNAYARTHQPASAVASWKRSIVLDPKNTKAMNNLGAVLIGMNREKEAEAILVRAVTVAPEYAEAHRNLGETLARQGRQEDAVREWSTAFRLDPGNIEAGRRLGAVRLDTRDFVGAAEILTAVLKRAPEDVPALINLSIAEEGLGKPKRAALTLEKALVVAERLGHPGLAAECRRRLAALGAGHPRR